MSGRRDGQSRRPLIRNDAMLIHACPAAGEEEEARWD